MGMNNVTTNLFELQFQNWDTLKYQKKISHKNETDIEKWKQPIITISSQPGIDIRAIAPMLAKKFNLDLFDADIVDLIAKNANLSKQMVETLDEKSQSVLEDWLAEEIFDDEFTSKKYLRNLRAVVFTIAAHRNAIIIGRGVGFMIKPEDRLALRLIAPIEDRIQQVMQEQCILEPQAREYIENDARQRYSFVKKHYHADIDDPVHYNLVINTALNDPKVIVEIVKTVLNRKEPV